MMDIIRFTMSLHTLASVTPFVFLKYQCKPSSINAHSRQPYLYKIPLDKLNAEKFQLFKKNYFLTRKIQKKSQIFACRSNLTDTSSFFVASAMNSSFPFQISIVSLLASPFLVFILVIAIGIIFQPKWIIKMVQKFFPRVVFFHETTDKSIALTIDDGPNGQATHDILDVLHEHGCKATFFLIGENIEKFPKIVDRMNSEGHELANHTMKDVASWQLSKHEFEQSLLDVDKKISHFFWKDENGTETKWFRPGHGWFNRKIISTLKKHNYRLALGSLFPMDCMFEDWSQRIANYCLWKIYPGCIVILHDRPQQSQQTLEVLRILLPQLKKDGFSVTTLSSLIQNRAKVEQNG